MSSHQYEIRIEGRLGPRLAAWFGGLTVTAGTDGTTTLYGPITDQAELHGVLQRFRDLGIPLISVTRAAPGDSIGETP